MSRSIQALILLACTLPLASQAVLLYDASLGTFPGTQGWIGVIDASTGQTHNGSATRLDTTSAEADVLLGDIEMIPPPDLAVPETKTALPLLIVGLSGLLRRKRD